MSCKRIHLLPFALWLAGCAGTPDAAGRPNVVVILADDLGWGDLGCYGNTVHKTPRLDRLAAEGVRMTDFYVPVPYCAPSRAALLTGRYPVRCGLTLNPVPASDFIEKKFDEIGLPTEEVTLADLFRGAGYATGCFGKWHLGHQPRFLPTRRGFDEYLGVLYSNDMHPVELIDGEARIEYPVVQATLTRRLTERAVAFIERNTSRPFFLYFPEVAVHKPLAPSEDFYGKSGAGLYADAVAELDWSVGRVLDALEANGLAENTLVIFTSDNGPWYGGSSGGLRGMKGQTWEGGIRVPMIARRPGRIPAGRTTAAPGIVMDVFATTLAAAGVSPPGDRVFDGQDLTPVLCGGAPSPHEALFSYRADKLHSVRSGRWKLHLSPPGTGREKIWKPDEPWVDPRRPDGVRILAPFEQPHPSLFPGSREGDAVTGEALFDLEADRAETRNVAAAHPDEVARLRTLADRFRAGLGR